MLEKIRFFFYFTILVLPVLLFALIFGFVKREHKQTLDKIKDY